MNNQKENNHNKIYRFLFLVSYCLLFTACCLLCSCGKKGEPTLKIYEKPDPPSGLRAIHRESEIILLWEFPKDKEQSIKGFYLMRSTPENTPLSSFGKGVPGEISKEGSGDFEKIAFLKNDIRSYADTNFKIGSEYKYKIILQDIKGITSNDSNIIHIHPQNPPASPENLSFKIEYHSIMLTWKSTGEGILYNIYKSHKKGLYSLMPLNEEPLKETLFRDYFDITKPVYYTIRSLTGSNIWNEGPASKEIEINPSEFVPSSPDGIQAIVTEDNICLTWKESPETWIVGYKVYREIDKKEGFIFIGETATPAFIDKDNPLLKRDYRVTVLGPSKESPPAEIKDVVFIPYR